MQFITRRHSVKPYVVGGCYERSAKIGCVFLGGDALVDSIVVGTGCSMVENPCAFRGRIKADEVRNLLEFTALFFKVGNLRVEAVLRE